MGGRGGKARQAKRVTFETVRRLALSLPGVVEGTSYGTPAFKLRGALLIRLWEDNETLVLKNVEDAEREALVASDPVAFFTTPHYDGYPTVLIRFGRVTAERLQALFERSWRRSAARRLVAAYDAGTLAGGDVLAAKASRAPRPARRAPEPAQLVGVISDTHGLLRDEALKALAGCALIIHAGDVGSPDILEQLREVAPIVAVRGNVDRSTPLGLLPRFEIVAVAGKEIYVLHDIADLDLDPAAQGYDAVVYGHSHVPRVETKNGVVFLNPGSAGPRRFSTPVSLARLSVSRRGLQVTLVDLTANGADD